MRSALSLDPILFRRILPQFCSVATAPGTAAGAGGSRHAGARVRSGKRFGTALPIRTSNQSGVTAMIVTLSPVTHASVLYLMVRFSRRANGFLHASSPAAAQLFSRKSARVALANG